MFKRVTVPFLILASVCLANSASAQAERKGSDPAASVAGNEKAKTDDAGKGKETKAPPAPDAKAEPKADPKADKTTAPGTESTACASEDVVLIEPDKLRQFRDSLGLRLGGGCIVAFNASSAKVGNSKAPTLFLDGVEMKGLSATALRNVSGTIDLAFSLIRNSEEDDSRKSWDALLAKQRLGYPMKLPVALAISGSPAVIAAGERPMIFTTVQGGEKMVWGVTITGVLALLLGFAVLLRGNALRDSWGGAYSLGKSQMAFWGLIVFLSFLGVWIITGTMERIPPQTLVLLGISGATGLAAVLIGNTKDAPADAAAKLNAERVALMTKGAVITPQERQRVAQIDQDLIAIAAYAARRHVTLRDFFRDISDDGTGPSFHRVQVLIWTLLLGAVFVWSVTEVISMPEFPQTLLLLLGISNGTYLGFKFPEKV